MQVHVFQGAFMDELEIEINTWLDENGLTDDELGLVTQSESAPTRMKPNITVMIWYHKPDDGKVEGFPGDR